MNTAFLQGDSDAACRHEMSLLHSGLADRGWHVRSFPRSAMFAGEIVLSDDALVAGEVDIVVAAMKQIGIPIPPPIDYPSSLTPFLHRNIWGGQYGDLRRHLDSHFPRPLFAKPAGARKLFQGRVFRDIAELDRIATLPESTAILFSDVVPFISEFRFYVIRSRVVCCENYDGDPQDLVDESIVADAIATLDAAGQSFAAYAIDFGLLRTGETALVEMNDGFSVGTIARYALGTILISPSRAGRNCWPREWQNQRMHARRRQRPG